MIGPNIKQCLRFFALKKTKLSPLSSRIIQTVCRKDFLTITTLEMFSTNRFLYFLLYEYRIMVQYHILTLKQRYQILYHYINIIIIL